MVRFEDALELEYIDGKNWKVTADFYYDTDVPCAGGNRIKIPAGFITDFASIPKILWNILPPTAGYGKAAVIHDGLYRTMGLATRKQADDVLMEAMVVLGVDWLTRQAIYWGVRVGGRSSYHGLL
jgi:hypothetical protein